MSTVAAMSFGNFAANANDNLPEILSQLEGGGEVPEGEPVHMDVQIASMSDVQIQWYKDGIPLNAGSRFNTMCERGFASLDISYTVPEDSGIYCCSVANPFGIVQSKELVLSVIPEIDLNEQNVDLQASEFYEYNSTPIREYDQDQRSKPINPPSFIQQPIASETDILEGDPFRIECYLNTTKDSTLNIDWLKNGQPVGTGSRFNTFIDRGLIVLEVSYSLGDDSGNYTCMASNALGSVESQPVEIRCQQEARVVTSSILDETSISHLKLLEDPGDENDYILREPAQTIPPSFKGVLEPPMIQVNEDDNIMFAIPVDCGNGYRIDIEWRRDGKVITTGSRITGKLEHGIASLQINYTQPTDSGTYTCHLTTEHGSANSEPASLVCEASGTIIAASQLPGDKEKGLLAIEAIEANLHAPRASYWEEDGPVEPPTIQHQLEPIGEVDEGATVHFEIQIDPANDPSLFVEWYKNDKLLTSGTRFHVIYERGLACLDLSYTISEDSGDYWCRVKNKAGEIESNHVQLVCHAGASVITHSNLLPEDEGRNLIKTIEESDQDNVGEYRYIEEEVKNSAPYFDVKLQPATVDAGAPIRFLVRVSGKPTPQLTWFLNDEPIQQDSITKIYDDGAINYLEMSRCPPLEGDNQLSVLAQNQLGEAKVETILTVVMAEDFRPDLKHVKPTNTYKKMLGLRKVDCSPELNKALTKSKPSAQTIRDMERGTEIKARMFRSPEVVEAEKMLDQLALNLRKSDNKRSTLNCNGS